MDSDDQLVGRRNPLETMPETTDIEKFQSSHQPSSNIPYLIAVVIMTIVGVASTMIVLVLRPQADNAALFAAIAGFIAPTTMALLAFMKTQETHVLVNGRMDEFKRLLQLNADAAEEKARQKGVIQGKDTKEEIVGKDEKEPTK